MKTLPERINFLLNEKHWSSAELARRAGVSRAAVSDWRNGSVKTLTAEVASRLAAACTVDAIWVATGRGEPRQGVLDQSDTPVQCVEKWPFRTIDPARYAQLPDAVKSMIEGRALALIDEWETASRVASARDSKAF
jgi:transcriptional regulator with XRE-family HTH domain